jgi:Holliday junction resolvase RusA-like endonuclease
MTAFGMSPEETIAALIRRGVPEAKARATVRRQAPTLPQEARETVALPLTLTLPWSCLRSDNKRFSATVRNGSPLLVLHPEYREAKARIEGIARAKVAGCGPDIGPISLDVRVVLPDHRRHDVSNFAKIIDDALEGIVYQNDFQITKITITKAGVDIDAPRAEITVGRFA